MCAATAPIRPTTYSTARSRSFSTRRHHHALSRRLYRALALLEHFGYVDIDAWRLTARGAVLARIYHESDLLVAEALAEGLFDGLDPPELAAVVSSCTFETRPGRAPILARVPKAVAPRMQTLAGLAESLQVQEQSSQLPAHPGPRRGVRRRGLALGAGQRLEHVLERAELAPGDFVRNIKQLIDLLRQLAVVAAPDTAATARHAAASLQRGVVAASVGPALTVDGDGGPPTPPEGVAAASSPAVSWASEPGRDGSRGR